MITTPCCFEYVTAKILVGMKKKMSLVQNRTAELWRGFMPRRKEIINTVGKELYSLQFYCEGYFSSFNPANKFIKWSAVEVTDAGQVPESMEVLQLVRSLYAVFSYKGRAGESRVFQYIYTEWLPASGYELDDRPHFEVLGEKYANDSPESEEEIWIPIKPKHGVQE